MPYLPPSRTPPPRPPPRSNLNELYEFARTVEGGLSAEAFASEAEGGEGKGEVGSGEGLGADGGVGGGEALVAAMTHVRSVRINERRFDGMFEPLKNAVALLKKYEIHLVDEILEKLEGAPFKWEETKKLRLNARERLGPLQTRRQEIVKTETEAFGLRVVEFVNRFRDEAPFGEHFGEGRKATGADAAYHVLDQWHERLREVETEATRITRAQELFEMQAGGEWREISKCREELKMLKVVWDRVQRVGDIFSAYSATLWTAVDTDSMVEETRRLQKEMKTLPKAVLKWPVYVGMLRQISEMAVALPLVQDLRDDSMQPRHWLQLMQVCGRAFVMDEALQLDSLLLLELHKYEEGVCEVVEQARMELKLDVQLQKIEATWASLTLEYAPFKQTGVNVLLQPTEAFEALDEHEAALQNMIGNRFMGHFECTITSWKRTLSSVRTSLEVWLDVQRAWCSLESIFLGSEDIREQLPEDARRFDAIDGEWREQMAEASNVANPISACTASGREEALAKCHANLELCQKSLTEYLELKKKRFPRFYFLSNVDLVDILSKGRNPPAVQAFHDTQPA